MNAQHALNAARTAGIRIQVEGDHLLLEAAAPPPPAVIDLLTRHKRALMALIENPVIEWLKQNPEPSEPGHCAWCNKRETAAAVVVPFGVQAGTHTWLHPECWSPWHQARRDRARVALTGSAGMP
jgi:hypothetical protein